MPREPTEARPSVQFLRVEGHELRLTNLAKVFYPKTGFTKGELIDYYVRIGPTLLPHLAGRPISMKRYPHGVDHSFFFQKQSPPDRPPWMKTADVWSDERGGRTIEYCTASGLADLVWLANAANLEMHTFLHRGDDIERPTHLVFDLDPGEGAPFDQVCQAAILVRDVLKGAGLDSVPKSSGSKGIHVHVPLNTPTSYEETKTFANHLASGLERRLPKQFTARMGKTLRKGRVFVDWSQNDRHKTTVCAYSMRAKSEPTVAAPLKWSEVEGADPHLLHIGPDEAVQRVKKMKDLFAPVLEKKQKLKAKKD